MSKTKKQSPKQSQKKLRLDGIYRADTIDFEAIKRKHAPIIKMVVSFPAMFTEDLPGPILGIVTEQVSINTYRP